MDFNRAFEFVSGYLKNGLDSTLYYHNYDHTMYVIESAMKIAAAEGITDNKELMLLKTAALFHDCGFVNTYNGHEEDGCKIAREYLPKCGYTKTDIETICNIIMSTITPQKPVTLLEKILCDADLFYLGTDSFETTGRKLYQEWKVRDKINSEEEWNNLQIDFLKSHHYHTASAAAACDPGKAAHLSELLRTKNC